MSRRSKRATVMLIGSYGNYLGNLCTWLDYDNIIILSDMMLHPIGCKVLTAEQTG